VHLVVSPLYHSGPFRFALVTALTGGRLAVLPRFDAAAWRDALRAVRPTSVFCVPTHLHRLLALPALVPDDLASLTLLAHAGAPCPVPLKERVLEVAPDGAVWEFYGSTEGQFTVARPTCGGPRPGPSGTPGRTVGSRSAATGRPLPAGAGSAPSGRTSPTTPGSPTGATPSGPPRPGTATRSPSATSAGSTLRGG
jgi:long-chain acyl-CoA synthetase